MDTQPGANEGPAFILKSVSPLDRLTCSPPRRAVLDRTRSRAVGTTSHRAFDLGDHSGADAEAQAEPFGQEQVRAQRESESIGEGRRDCLQLVADRGIWGLRQRQAFGSALQGLIDDLLSPPAVRQLARADDICDERVGDIHSFTITLVIPRIQGISRNGCCPPLPTASLSRPCTRASTSTVPEPGSLAG